MDVKGNSSGKIKEKSLKLTRGVTGHRAVK
jgi:hypothetical protein